jgi:RNA polymerase sigma-70 factor (sigma-E family)
VGGSESQSFEAWARANGAQLRRAALLLTGNAQDADDLVQDAMVRVYAKWPRIRDMENRDGYARRALVNRHLSLGRRLQRFKARQDVLGGSESASEEPPDTTLIAHADLQRALMTLGPRQRAVVVLRYYLDLPDAQVAEILDCTPSTVRTQARRALATLRHSAEIGEYDHRQER